ncbi:MAG: hypothetical protein K0R09_959 [Clostridiales bacterium]|nr:hypothetical protein [Clostridiales bacterium]
MTTIVLHKSTDRKFILIGTGYETPNKSNYIEPLYGSLHRNRNHCAMEMATVCDREGHISFISPEELIVLEIDGVSPSQIIV